MKPFVASRRLAIILVAIVAATLPLSHGNLDDSAESLESRSVTAREMNQAQQIILSQLGRSFQASLEQREAAEFLLLPAQLVQEALSENTIPYPR